MTEASELLALAERGKVFDKTGREIKVGDVLKVYHFTGARWRKRYFMYKQVVGECTLGKGLELYLQVSHLAMKPFGERGGGYHLAKDGRHHRGIEIIQGLDWHHDRPRAASLSHAESLATGEQGR